MSLLQLKINSKTWDTRNVTMHVGISARTFTVPEPGGAAQTGMKFVRRLPDQDTDVTLFGHPNVHKRFPGMDLDSAGYITDSLAYGLVWEQLALPYRGRRRDLDVLFCPNTYCPLRDTSFLKVIAIHSLTSYHGFSPGMYAQFRRAAVPRAIGAADIVIAVSKYMRDEIVDRFRIPRDKVRVVHNGIDPVYLDGTHSSPMDRLPDEYLLYVGALSENKNIDGIIRAYRKLRNKYGINHKLVLLGSTSNPTIATISESELGSDIVLPGYIRNKTELKYAYENASVFLFPSFYESFGLPPLEAMACGTPVVASNSTALPEICGDAACLVDPADITAIADGIYRILENEKYATQLVGAGLERANKFSWDTASARLRSILCESIK